MRVGLGFDSHRLVSGRRLVLCGMEIPHEKGLAGHSDADVALHALCDAILGAAGLPDLGTLFPDTDPRFRGAESTLFLRETLRLIKEKGLSVHQVDLVLVLSEPKIAPYRERLRENLSRLLEIPPDRVGLKAKTPEGLPLSAEEVIVAWAVAVLRESPS